jgi:hypothetical protein
MNIKYGVIGLFRIGDLFFPEKQEVGKGKKGGKIKQITHFEQYGRFQTPPVILEWLKNKDGYNEKNDIPYEEKGLKNTMKEIAHMETYMKMHQITKS